MIYRITGGVFLLLTALEVFGITSLTSFIGVFAFIAGVALLAGQ